MQRREFLALAKELSVRTSEGCWRTAVSRAYYAAFHRTRDFMATLGFRTRKNDQAHTGLYRRLSSSKSDVLIEAGRLLLALRSLRNQADYDLDYDFQKAEAVEAAKDAETIFDQLNSQNDPALLVKITDTIRAYERDVLREATWQQP